MPQFILAPPPPKARKYFVVDATVAGVLYSHPFALRTSRNLWKTRSSTYMLTSNSFFRFPEPRWLLHHPSLVTTWTRRCKLVTMLWRAHTLASQDCYPKLHCCLLSVDTHLARTKLWGTSSSSSFRAGFSRNLIPSYQCSFSTTLVPHWQGARVLDSGNSRSLKLELALNHQVIDMHF